MFKLAKTYNDNNIAANNKKILDRQNEALNKVIEDLQTGLTKGLIPSKFQNIDKLSQIGNYLLQGTASDPASAPYVNCK